MLELAAIQEARAAIAGHVHRTPLLSSRALARRTGAAGAFIKAETLQRTGSFKVRGALYKVATLSADEKARGLIAVSAGNHAQGVAYAAAAQHARCIVVMPEAATRSKVAASRAYGAEVVLHGTVGDAFDRCLELQREHGYTFVHPFDDLEIMAGQGTVALEILDDAPDATLVVVPVGGGGLISGVAAAVKAVRPSARVVGVEPTGAAALTRALSAGTPVRLERIDTIADGLSAPATGEHVLEHVRALVDDVVLVSDDDLARAMHFLLERAKLLAEPAGAAAVAALLAGKIRVEPDDRIVAIASGGNIDLTRLTEILDR